MTRTATAVAFRANYREIGWAIPVPKNVIPKKVRIACYIVVIATFVTVVELVMQISNFHHRKGGQHHALL